jgi:hypothetical protein
MIKYKGTVKYGRYLTEVYDSEKSLNVSFSACPYG